MNMFLKSLHLFASVLKNRPIEIYRTLSTSQKLHIKIALCGCGGGVGMPTAFLLKLSPLVKELALWDVQDSVGIHVDLSHINTRAKTAGYVNTQQLDSAFKNKDIIVICSGMPRKEGMTRKDLFTANADIIRMFIDSAMKVAPRAIICIVTNPVNGLVPVAAGILKKADCYDPKRLFGVTTLDVVRTSAFLADELCLDPTKLDVPVIGGHSATTMVPLFSQANQRIELPKDRVKALTGRIQEAGMEVIKARGRSATLSTAFATARFVLNLCRAMKGESNIIECAYVESDLTDAKFFTTPILLGPEGVKTNRGFGKLNDFECSLVNKAIKELLIDIKEAEDYVKGETKSKK